MRDELYRVPSVSKAGSRLRFNVAFESCGTIFANPYWTWVGWTEYRRQWCRFLIGCGVKYTGLNCLPVVALGLDQATAER